MQVMAIINNLYFNRQGKLKQNRAASNTASNTKLNQSPSNPHENAKGRKYPSDIPPVVPENKKEGNKSSRAQGEVANVTIHHDSVSYCSISTSQITTCYTLKPIDLGVSDIAFIDDELD